MNVDKADDGSKKVKNIAAVVYLAVLIFIVGGSYINQQRGEAPQQATESASKP
jgi:hypothetical protein